MNSTISGPPPEAETTQDKTETKVTHPVPGYKLTFLAPTGLEFGPPG